VETLEVLRCTKCNAPLVLADSESVTCPGCGTVNAVPEPYRALHRARLLDKGAREQAEKVLRRLDQPPSMLTKLIAKTFDQNMFVFILLFGIPLGIGVITFSAGILDVLAAHLRLDDARDLPWGYTAVVVIVGVFVVAFVPRAFGVYANRRIVDRTKLLAALAAKPPSVPGAASLCRICGAPLAVEKDEIVAVCSYCRAQNAVHLETNIATQTNAIATAVGHEVHEAAHADADARSATQKLMHHELRRYAIRTILVGVGFALACQETPDHTPTTLGLIGIIATPLMIIYFIISSMSHTDEDAEERRAHNDAPGGGHWVLPVIGALILLRIC